MPPKPGFLHLGSPKGIGKGLWGNQTDFMGSRQAPLQCTLGAYIYPRTQGRLDETTREKQPGALTNGPSSSSISEAPARSTSSRAAAAMVSAAAIPRSLTSGS